eukprot:scaffold119345_cov72-Phaeocystis_antarctica.AAC.8
MPCVLIVSPSRRQSALRADRATGTMHAGPDSRPSRRKYETCASKQRVRWISPSNFNHRSQHI